jgi:membrane-associated phospholipid phosphatase
MPPQHEAGRCASVIPSQERFMKPHARILSLVASLTVGALGCADSPSGPYARAVQPTDQAALDAVKFWEGNAAANWTDQATSLAARRTVNVARLFTYLSLAQLRAAEDAEVIVPHPPTSAAIGAASAAILKVYFPADVAEIESALDAQEAGDPWPGAKHEDFAAGAAIGRAAAARVIAYSSGDLYGLADPGIPPTGPGKWVWKGGPIARASYGARPFFLTSRDEFRPLPPPTFGSPAYLAALGEVRLISDTRTAEQLAIAQYWAVNQSPVSTAAMTNLAVGLIREHRKRDHEAARILFLMNAAAWDALIGCFDAKYYYWFIRPPQADPAITLPIGLPPHPSYPSAHSCISGSSTEVLAASFPSERRRLEQIAEEASLSRLYAGIHYRFDMEAGLALGRAAAGKALSANLAVAAIP